MIKKIFKPFWSYDVIETEKWLMDMAGEGYILKSFNPLTRNFLFQKSKKSQQSYRILYSKDLSKDFSNSMKKEGWEIIAYHRKWYILSHKKSVDEISVFPSREGIIHHQRTILFVFSGILIYFLINMLLSVPLLLIVLYNGGDVIFVPSPYWVFTILGGIISLILLGIAIYSVVKIRQVKHKLIGKSEELVIDVQEPEEGKIVKKRKWYWHEAPDLLETWLERMENKGYHLFKVSKRGLTFYFKKSNPQKTSYFVDFQYFTNKDYFDLHRDSGWLLRFSSNGSLFNWSIWSQSYKNDEEKPKMYTNASEQLKNAGKISLMNFLFSFPFILLIYIMLSQKDFFHLQMGAFHWILLSIYVLGLIVFLARIIRSFFYFLRVRKESKR